MKSLFRRKILLAHYRIQRAILFICFILCGYFSFSQSARELSTKNGLPQSFVSGLVQDDSSFIWIGTRNGLARYDGIQFKTFQHDPHDSTTLASNLIIWIRKDRHNQLWIEHESGEIDEMNPVTEKITHFLKGNASGNNTILFLRRGWMFDSDGTFWGIVGGNGLNIRNRNKTVEHFTHASAGFESDTILGLEETRNSAVWILELHGIALYNKNTKQFTHWRLPYSEDYGDFKGSETIAIDLHERQNGELMWGDRKSLYFFNPSNHSFRRASLPYTSYLGVRWIRPGSDGFDYIESYGKVYRYSDQAGVVSIGETIANSFGDAKSFLVDHSGLIWMGTNADGIHQIDMQTPFFKSFAYKKEFVTDMLLQELGVNMQEMFNWTGEDNVFSSPSYHIRSVYDAHRRLYIGLKETICYYDSAQKKFIKLPHVPVVIGSDQSGIGIKGITVESDGSLMVVGFGGNIVEYHFASKSWAPFMDPLAIRNKFGTSVLIQDIYSDSQSIWITTAGNGLLKIDEQTKQIQQFRENPAPGSLPTDQLLGLRADPSRPDILWIGSYQGLIAFNKKTSKAEVYSVKEGMPDNTIYAILPDREGNLWVTTNKGICRFDPVSHTTRVFSTQHGLPGDEFNRFHELELPDGRLTFGGTDGWTIFNPLLIQNDHYDPALAFTDLRINNKSILPGKNNRILPLPLNAMDKLVLPYEQNTININFAGMEFSQPQDIQYRYRLEGYDTGWVNAGNGHQAMYTKIPPGNYTLFVNASNTSGKWSSQIKSLPVKVESPWYSTRLAFFCYCIILAGLIWAFIRIRVDRMVMKQEMVLKEKESSQLKELDDMKSRFFSNITHEFRTPLTLIMGPAEQLKSFSSENPQQTRLADTIVNNAKQMLVLINRLMDLSKLEAKALQLHEQRGSPADIVGTIVHSFNADAEAKEIELSFDDQTAQIDCWFYADAMERIVYNLVSNALKFTEAGGHVEVILVAQNEKLFLTVKDNGIGIPEEKLPHIFERFFQADEYAGMSNEELNQGTGIGLSLVKELVNQVNGEIRAESWARETDQSSGGTLLVHQENGEIRVESRVREAGQSSGGTVFRVEMPYRLVEEEKIVDSVAVIPDDLSGEALEGDDKMQQILLVEDNPELGKFIEGILGDTYQVKHVLNGALGLESALTLMPDLIISDVMMPVMDGYEMCKRLKSDIRTSHIPVILLTAKVSQENLIEGLEQGADDYLTKPFHPTELLLRIHNLFKRQSRLRERMQQELSLPDGAIATAESIPQDIFLTRLYEMLDEHLDDSLFGVDQLVGLMNMSRSSLHRKLKALTNLSTTEVVRNYRLKKATQFLREGYSSSDAAYKTGFGSPAYFSKSFREVYGITPGEYRKV